MPKNRKSFRAALAISQTRKEKNKLSAAKSRQNKKAFISQMEQQILELQREVQNLRDQLMFFKQPISTETFAVNTDDLFVPFLADFEQSVM